MIDLLRNNIRIAVLAVVAIALLIGCIVLYLQWQSAQDTQSEQESDRARVASTLVITRTQYDVATLQARWDELSGKPEFPTKLPVVDLSRYLARGEEIYRVDIVEVGPIPVGVETIGGKSYPAYETKVTVMGELTKIISYLEYIEEGPYTSIKVEGVEFTGSGTSWKGEFTIVFITQG